MREKELISKKTNKILQERGITLVALVITIVVIIILATVTINFAFGQGGLIKQAEDARDYYANDTKYTEESLANVTSYLNEVMGEDSEITPPTPQEPPTDGSFSEEEGVNTPNIGDNMQLVVFDEDTSTWIEDTTKEAYSYLDTSISGNENKSEWANAKVTTQVGDETIESYFVWIPRFAYKINGTNDIDVKFINGTGKTTVDGIECKYASENPTADDYIVHPAFTDEEENGGWDSPIAGIWVGKYETSSVEGNSNSTSGDNVTTKTAQVKPNVSSWRYIGIANMFTVAKAYAPNLESHLLKNSEWGAVAYLTESQYGRNGTEVSMNNNGETYYTGGGENNTYVTHTDQSSTGNVYGIYDLSGNAYELVAAGYSNQSDIGTESGSTKYATVYSGTSASTAYKYGDATYETSGWDSNLAGFVNPSDPFFCRGGDYYNGDTGLFAFFGIGGVASSNGSFRLVLVV